MKKRTISWILVLVLMLSISSLPAALAEGEADTFSVSFDSDAESVQVYNNSYDSNYTVYINNEDVFTSEDNNITVTGVQTAENAEITLDNITNEENSTNNENNSGSAHSNALTISTENGNTTVNAENVESAATATAPAVSENEYSYVTATSTAVRATATGDADTTLNTSDLTASASVTATEDTGSSYAHATALEAIANNGGKLTVQSEEVTATAESSSTSNYYSNSATGINAYSNGGDVDVIAESAEAIGKNAGATGVSASSSPTYNGRGTAVSEEASGGTTTVTIEQGVTAKGTNQTTGVAASSYGEDSTTNVVIGKSVEAESIKGEATGVSTSSNSNTSYSEDGTPSVGAGGTTTVTITEDVSAISTNSSATGVRANAQGADNTVAIEGNVIAEGNSSTTGIYASSSQTGVYNPVTQEREYSGNGGTTTVTVDGGVTVTGHKYSIGGIYAYAYGEDSSTTVNTGDVTVSVTKIDESGKSTGEIPPEGTTPGGKDVPPDENSDVYNYEEHYFNPRNYGSDSMLYTSATGIKASASSYDEDQATSQKVTVTTGNVIVTNEAGSAAGIIASGDGATVTSGDVSVEGSSGYGIQAINNAEVTVNNVTADRDALTASTGGVIKATGDVEAGNNAIVVSLLTPDDTQSKIIVEGTVDSNNQAIRLNLNSFTKPLTEEEQLANYEAAEAASKSAYDDAIKSGKTKKEAYQESSRVYYEALNKETDDWVNTEEGVNAVIEALPQIIVQTITQKEDVDMVLVTGLNKENNEKVTEEVLSQVYYIVNTEGLDTANIAVYGYEEVDGYMVAHETYKLTVKCIGDGTITAVTAGEYATVEDNNDGTYTITVNRGGDLRLTAEFTANPNEVPQNNVPSSNSGYVPNFNPSYVPNFNPPGSVSGTVLTSGTTRNPSDPFLYVEDNFLVADMTNLGYASILISTINRFLENNSLNTFKILTTSGSFSIAIDQLMQLLEGADCLTLVAEGDSLVVCANWTAVTTLSMSKNV